MCGSHLHSVISTMLGKPTLILPYTHNYIAVIKTQGKKLIFLLSTNFKILEMWGYILLFIIKLVKRTDTSAFCLFSNKNKFIQGSRTQVLIIVIQQHKKYKTDRCISNILKQNVQPYTVHPIGREEG